MPGTAAALAWIRLLLAVLGGVAVVALVVFTVLLLVAAMSGADAGTSADYGSVY